MVAEELRSLHMQEGVGLHKLEVEEPRRLEEGVGLHTELVPLAEARPALPRLALPWLMNAWAGLASVLEVEQQLAPLEEAVERTP